MDQKEVSPPCLSLLCPERSPYYKFSHAVYYPTLCFTGFQDAKLLTNSSQLHFVESECGSAAGYNSFNLSVVCLMGIKHHLDMSETTVHTGGGPHNI